MPVPADDLPDNLKVPASDLPDHLAASPTKNAPTEAYEGWDVRVSPEQTRVVGQMDRERTQKADETLKLIESTAPEPGLQHLLWSIVGGPLEIAVRGGQSALGERPPPSPAEALEEAALAIRPTSSLTSGLPSIGATGARTMTGRGAPSAWTPEQVQSAAHALNAPKAVKLIEKRLNKTEPKTAQAAIDKFNEAGAAGDPLMLPDVFPEAERLAGRMARAPGEASGIMTSALEDRNAGAVERQIGNINRDVGSNSAYQMFDDLKQSRSEAAKPLFDKAQAGGSIAPLETQLQDSFNEASIAEGEATRALRDARNQLTVASGKQTQTGGNVYSTSAANQEAREAQIAVSQAEHNLALASRQKGDTLDMLRQAQEDRTLGKPGAVWNPRIQQFLEDPDIKAGIHRGWEMERNTALGKGRALNTTEYAITGFEPDGAPIVSKVPTFKLLQVAKEGLDAMLEGEQYRDKFTGALNKFGNSLKDKSTGYLQELDKANPDYRPAREQWSGDTANMRALKTGQTALKNKPEINARLAADMTESERESAKLGLAQTLREVANDKGPLAGEFNTIAGTQYGAEGNRARIAPFFNDAAELDRFVKSTGREQTKARTANRVLRGSQTAGRLAEDESPISGKDIAHAGIAGALGHKTTLLNRIVDMSQNAWDRRGNPRTNAEIARILGNAGLTVQRDAYGRIILDQLEPPP